MTTLCEKLGYHEGDIFIVIATEKIGNVRQQTFKLNSIVVLTEDDNSDAPRFDLIKGACYWDLGVYTDKGCYENVRNVRKLTPKEVVTALTGGKK